MENRKAKEKLFLFFSEYVFLLLFLMSDLLTIDYGFCFFSAGVARG